MTRQTLAARIAELQSRYDRDAGALQTLERRHAELTAAKARLDEDIATWEAVQLLYAKTSEYARAKAKAHIERIVTSALQAVFGRPTIRFEIVLRATGNSTSAEWHVVDELSDSTTVAGPVEDSRGGGVVDVTSLALRFAVLELARPKVGGPILLDEPGRHVSESYRRAFAEWIKSYARARGRQIVMVTHAEELAEVADVAYRVERGEDGVSRVVRV